MSSKTLERKFRVALVNPLGKWQTRLPVPPLGLSTLIKYYEIHGKHKNRVEFRIFDEVAEPNASQELFKWEPQIVGIGTMSGTRTRAFELAAKARQQLPEALVVGGGVHFQICQEDGLADRKFDANCVGEGEEALRLLIDKTLQEELTFDDIPNLAWLDKKGRIQKSPRWIFSELDSMPLPDPERLALNYYFKKRQFVPGIWARSAYVLSSRGCPFKCSFCFNSFEGGATVRYHSIPTVIDHILYIKERYGIRHFIIAEDLFFMDRKRVRAFCESLLQKAAGIQWNCNARPSLVRDEDLALFKLMRDSGCIQVQFGFESGSDEVLARIKGKDASVAKNQRALDVVYAAGIPIFGYFMCGIPGETEEQMEMTAAFIEKNFSKMKHFEYFIYTPFPGAELSEQIRAEGLLEGISMDDLALSMFSQGKPMVFNSKVPAEKVLALRRRLKRKVMEKHSFLDKFHWLISEGFDNPIRTWRRLMEIYRIKSG